MKSEVTHRANDVAREREATERGFECPLLVAMRATGRVLAQEGAAHAAGEVARAERLRSEREGWRHVYNVSCQQICVALRESTNDAAAATTLAAEALKRMPDTVPATRLAALRRQLTSCALYVSYDDCPLLRPRMGADEAYTARHVGGDNWRAKTLAASTASGDAPVMGERQAETRV